KYNVGELYKEEDGSIEITELNNIEQKLKEIHKTNSKITTVALITGIMSRPIYTSRITYMMSRAKNTPSSTQ
ncbi:MAG: hypothetical protein KKH40_05370, partial [Nanoarchaeota archaeon]|nr:hypothetical protein [Nanoarchaeota archaeon]